MDVSEPPSLRKVGVGLPGGCAESAGRGRCSDGVEPILPQGNGACGQLMTFNPPSRGRPGRPNQSA